MSIVGDYIDLVSHLESDCGLFDDKVARRFAALAAMPVSGSPARTCRAVLRIADSLKEAASWTDPLNNSIRFCIAAVLHGNGIEPRTFLTAHSRAKGSYRGFGMVRQTAWELQATLFLLVTGQRPDPATIGHLRELYEAAKEHHYWYTSGDDYAALSMLVDRPGCPTALLRDIEDNYEDLVYHGIPKGNSLQTAALMFGIAGAGSREIERAGDLWSGFRSRGLWMFGSDADEIGLLALTGGRAESLVDSALEIRRELRRKPHDHGNDISFRIACSLAYLEHAELQDPRLNAMKALLDMQGLIQARQSAAAGGAAAT